MSIFVDFDAGQTILESGVGAESFFFVLQGTVDTAYSATNYFYTLNGVVLDPPYSELGDFFVNSSGLVIGTATSVRQESIDIGLRGDSLSRSAQVLEVSMGARWRPLGYMDVFVGYRSIQYGGVAVDLRPRNVVIIGTVINTTDATQIDRSATYKGFYGGVGFHF